MRKRPIWSLLAAIAVLLMVGSAACSSGGASGDATTDATTDGATTDAGSTDGDDPTEVAAGDFDYPEPDWVTADPEAEGIDPAVLEEMRALAEAQPSFCLSVTRHGRLVGEWYWGGWDETTTGELFSATKSITAALVGIAQDRGELDVDEPASEYIEEWQGTPSEDVTIRNLISNDSGREWDFETDYVEIAGAAPDKTAASIALGQQHEPGEHWEYNNAAIQTLEAVLEEATGRDVAEYAREHLFEPTGMSAEMGTDASDNTITFFAAEASCRDLARFGNLFLRDGEWADGEQVISSEFVEEATSPSTELNSAYGYLFWLNREGRWVEPSGPGGTRDEGVGFPDPGVPEDMFAAQGLGGQVSIVYPSTDVVVTRIGPAKADPDGSPDFQYQLKLLGAELVTDPQAD